jgi:hypothetical protein
VTGLCHPAFYTREPGTYQQQVLAIAAELYQPHGLLHNEVCWYISILYPFIVDKPLKIDLQFYDSAWI